MFRWMKQIRSLKFGSVGGNWLFWMNFWGQFSFIFSPLVTLDSKGEAISRTTMSFLMQLKSSRKKSRKPNKWDCFQRLGQVRPPGLGSPKSSGSLPLGVLKMDDFFRLFFSDRSALFCGWNMLTFLVVETTMDSGFFGPKEGLAYRWMAREPGLADQPRGRTKIWSNGVVLFFAQVVFANGSVRCQTQLVFFLENWTCVLFHRNWKNENHLLGYDYTIWQTNSTSNWTNDWCLNHVSNTICGRLERCPQ